jgi:hypothetical protein
MNEQLIERLFIEAQKQITSKTTKDFANKFTELIVKECCVIVNQEALLTDHVPAEMNAYAGKRLKNAYIKIEEHFGVKE